MHTMPIFHLPDFVDQSLGFIADNALALAVIVIGAVILAAMLGIRAFSQQLDADREAL